MTEKKASEKTRGKTTRQYKSRDERRQEILEVADTLFMAKGFLATGVKDIVKAVGISYGNFYYHFPTKRDILLAFVQGRARKLRRSVEEWREAGESADRQMERYLDFVDSMRSFRISVDFLKGGEAREDPELYDTFVSESLHEVADSVALILEQGTKEGTFRVHDPKATALLMLMMTLEMLHRVATLDRHVEWKRLRKSYRISVSRMIGVDEERYL